MAPKPAPREKRIVVALGGNASYPPTIRGTANEQLAIMAGLCEHLVRIIQLGYKLVLTHGNGPVVGNILFRMARTATELPPMPMDVCVAHSQGGMGYMFQQSFTNTLHKHSITTPTCSVVTQVEVDPNDPAFSSPTKPVGRFFAEAEARRMQEETGWMFVEDSGRGWRRVVASPTPQSIVDLAAIEALLSANVIPIAAGGGGIPVVRLSSGEWEGVPAVIDKDLTSALLAAAINADTLLLVTGIERVAIDFGKPTQRFLDAMTVAEAARYLEEGQFPPGSMGPKIRAAINYLEQGGKLVLITSLERAFDAVEGRAGTRITA
ncbi:MAG: carbamate kinase [Betaproteobacteria bacterium]|nr:carbamate kinase [Betaproteobacteria bacterium]